MLLVVTVVAICAVLGYSMLSSASLRTIVGDNSIRIAQADALAESGINAGVYYLRCMDDPQLTTLKRTGSLALTAQLLSASSPGTYDLTIGRITLKDASNQDIVTDDYTVTSIGRAGGSSSAMSTLKAVVRVNFRFRPLHSFSANGPINVHGGLTPMRVYQAAPFGATPDIHTPGAIQSPYAVTLSGGGIYGDVSAPDYSHISGVFTGTRVTPSDIVAAPRPSTTTHPDWGDVKVYGPTYEHDGKECQATIVSGTVASWPMHDMELNPLGIYYSASDLTILDSSYGSTTGFAGSLVVNGNLTVGATGFSTTRVGTVTPLGGPALVVKGDLVFASSSAAKHLTINGLVYVGGVVRGGIGSSTCSLTVNGALLVACGAVGGTSPVEGFTGRITLNYVPDHLDIPEFSRISNQDVEGVSLISFSSGSH